MIYYKEPVYRPPSEANSLLIQVTEGCSYNCTFCIGNEGKKFLVRSIDEIKKDIDNSAMIYGNSVRKMFLLDGNAFVIKPEQLTEIAAYAYKKHPKLTRIGAYAHSGDILKKTDSDLKKIKEAGVKIVYLGIETGDDDLLKAINKKVTSNDIIEAIHKLYKAGITLSATIILGLAGNNSEASRQHAIQTAMLINKIKPGTQVPWYLSALTLMIPRGTTIYNDVKTKQFHPMTNLEILEELLCFLENLDDDLSKCIFRVNHASNYLELESNNLAKNKNSLIEQVKIAITNPSRLKKESFRGL